ncbi:MAG: hypothetical protein C3F07_10015 [Anaerolineales bacterium]|nr:hypothetical protein [Anaerolineae bacterium]PWB73180.1 MAG: hypothetical protein C3F07_10015 [Anaerolineales bacterium]
MQTWEYLALNRAGGRWSDDQYDGRSSSDKLSDLGAEGWELVSVCYDGSGYNFYLKRPIPKPKAPRKSKAKQAAD